MKKFIALIATSLFAIGTGFASDAKEQTLTGKAMCAKCELSEADKCTNALQVADKDGKVTTYLLADNKVGHRHREVGRRKADRHRLEDRDEVRRRVGAWRVCRA